MAAHETIHGRKAALAVLRTRMDDVVRIAHGARGREELGPWLREAAARRIPYAERSDEELARLSGSVHHEGLVVVARARPGPDPRAVFERMVRAEKFLVVALDGVSNPHNVGAVVRTAAFLGIDALLVRGRPERPALTAAAVRIAEGAAEHLPTAVVPDLDAFLRAARREGITTLGADARGKRDALTMRWPARGVLVLGNEARGLSAEVAHEIDVDVAIRGTGAVESLNVGVAAGILCAAWTASVRRRP